MFKSATSVVNDLATVSSAITGTLVNTVLLADDTVLLARDQVAIWRHQKELEMQAMGLTSTTSASKIAITSPKG